MTIQERVARARSRFKAAGIPDAEADLDARVLAEYALEWDTARFLSNSSETETPDFAARYEALTDRRAHGSRSSLRDERANARDDVAGE